MSLRRAPRLINADTESSIPVLEAALCFVGAEPPPLDAHGTCRLQVEQAKGFQDIAKCPLRFKSTPVENPSFEILQPVYSPSHPLAWFCVVGDLNNGMRFKRFYRARIWGEESSMALCPRSSRLAVGA